MSVKFLTEVQGVIEKLKDQEYQWGRVKHILSNARTNNQQVFLCGNGGSAGTAEHLACDLFKMANIDARNLGENFPLVTAIINDDGWENLYRNQLKGTFKKGDVLIAISVHGGFGKDKADMWSQNLLKAIDYANSNGGLTIGFSGFDGGEFKNLCNINIIVPSESTPIIESLHCLIGHLISFALYEGDRK